MSVPNSAALASLIEERLDQSYDDGGGWDIAAHAVENIIAVALDDGETEVREFRAVVVEGDETPIVAARPDLDDADATHGVDFAGHDDVFGWALFATDHVIYSGTGHISFDEARRFGAALIALADAHEDATGGGR